MDDNNTRLRIATRIHFALLRHLGEGIDVGKMLRRESEAREVLWVCQASGDAELVALARQYERAGRLQAAARRSTGGHAPQETAWARDTSGFGLTQPPAPPAARRKKAPVPQGWFKPVATWLRGGAR